MSYIDYVFQGDPNPPPIESTFPQTPGSPSNPLLLFLTYCRLLYINTGGSPLWPPLAQLSPNQVIQHLSQPLLGTVITKLQTAPNSALCEPFAQLLIRG